jgi:hypothetical protein
MDDNPNPNAMTEADDAKHTEANINMRLDAIEKRVAVAVNKLQAAMAMAAYLTPRGERYEQ